jgi:hypothetical protein
MNAITSTFVHHVWPSSPFNGDGAEQMAELIAVPHRKLDVV